MLVLPLAAPGAAQ